MYIAHFTYPFFCHGHLGYFYLLAVLTNAAVHMGVCLYVLRVSVGPVCVCERLVYDSCVSIGLMRVSRTTVSVSLPGAPAAHDITDSDWSLPRPFCDQLQLLSHNKPPSLAPTL